MLPKHVSKFASQHGEVRYRHRVAGRPTRYFTAVLGTTEWLAEYALFEGGAPEPITSRFAPGSVDDLCVRYYKSQDFCGQGEVSQAKNRAVIEAWRAGRGTYPVAGLSFEALDRYFANAAKKKASKDGKRMLGGPAAAQRARKQLRRLFQHAVRCKLIRTNPVDDTAAVRYKTTGFHTWTEEEIVQFQARHPLGTKARVVLEIILWTGQRRGDAHRFGPQHIAGGKIRFEQEKKDGRPVFLNVAPDLRAAIDAMPVVGARTFLVTEAGRPFSKAGFGNWFRDRCDEAGLPQCSAHGLRKAIGRRLAEAGASNEQIKAVGDWTNDRQVSVYTADADQMRMAASGMALLIAAHIGSRGSDELAHPVENA